jgi:lysophospholipase L1-like esterase
MKENICSTFDFNKHAHYVGRLDWSDPGGPVLSWAGSSITVRFQGNGIILHMIAKERTESWFDIILDGGMPQKLHIGEAIEQIEFAAGLDNGPHTIELYKRTEAMFGTVQFLGCSLAEGGEFLPPSPTRQLKIVIIGDSISAGSGNEGKDGNPNIAEHENNRLAYGTLAAKALHAEHHTIAISGIGLMVNYGDERVNTMPDQYDRVNPLHPEMKWDFTSWIADVVWINLGTNDNGYAVDPAAFIDTYRKFIARIRIHYPLADIFLSLGPFQLTPVKDYIAEAFSMINKAGDKKVYYVLFDQADVEQDGLGETGHPNIRTHAKMADQMVREILGKRVEL